MYFKIMPYPNDARFHIRCIPGTKQETPIRGCGTLNCRTLQSNDSAVDPNCKPRSVAGKELGEELYSCSLCPLCEVTDSGFFTAGFCDTTMDGHGGPWDWSLRKDPG